MTISSTCGVIIRCDYRVLLWDSGNHYSCVVTAINSENPTIVEGITGEHISGKSDVDVEGFSMQLQLQPGFSTIPRNIETFFNKLVGFQWYDSNLRSINAKFFEPWPNLNVLYIWNSNIICIDGDLFRYIRRLRYIHFQNNRFERIGHNLLTGLNLVYAIFASNSCIHYVAMNSQDIQALNLQLPISCPPYQCNARCTINDEADDFERQLELQKEINKKQAQRFVEIEKQLIELSASTCSCL